MLKTLALFLTLIMVSTGTAFATQEITVSSMVELLDSIGSDRIIYLTPGTYKLDDALGFATRKSKNIYQRMMYISEVNNLKIIGPSIGKTELISPYSESTVLLIKDCRNLELRNFSIGHVKRPKGCEGDALSIEASRNVKLANMDIYGCGANGLTLRDVRQLEVKASYIHHCTYNLLAFSEVWDSTFRDTKFIHDGNFSVLSTTEEIRGLEFYNCKFIVDPAREVFTPRQDADEIEYAAKYSLLAQHYAKNWWDKEEIGFRDCAFTNINSLEIAQLRTKGIRFQNCQLKEQKI
mgnify:CR=1 FL=1